MFHQLKKGALIFCSPKIFLQCALKPKISVGTRAFGGALGVQCIMYQLIINEVRVR